VREFVVVGRGTPAPVAPPEALVVSGLYRWVRNPMYVGVLCWLAALALFFASGAIALYAAVVFAGFNAFVMGYEEPALRRRFGAAYERYCRSVPRWLPRPPRDGPA
jgi:protein-S-isoprenylcysteine O-methyltransferase Ste14